MAFVVVVVLLSAVVGTLLGRALGSGDAEPKAPAGAQTLTSGLLQIDLPPGWTRSRVQPTPGLPSGALSGARESSLGTQVALGVLPYESSTLLPVRLIEGMPLPPPRKIFLGRRFRAYDYAGLLRPGVRGVLDVIAVPTTRGVATVVCISPAELGTAPDCLTLARSLRLSRARPLPLSAATAFRARLPAELSILARERELARAGINGGDAGKTLALAGAFQRAATALARVAPRSDGAPAMVVRTLAAQANGYRRLATALNRGSRAAALRARARTRSLDAELRRRLATETG